MYFLKLAQKCVPGRTCPGHILDMSRTCTQNVPVLTILGHLQKCPESIYPMSFLNFSNLSFVLSHICLKMCPRPDMSRTRPGRVPDVFSKCPCPEHFGTSPNRTSATKHTKARVKVQVNNGSVKFGASNSAALQENANTPLNNQQEEDGRDLETLEGYFDNLAATAVNKKGVLHQLLLNNTTLSTNN